MHARRVASFLLAITCTSAGLARADDDPKRALPDYDGRGNEDAHDAHWALWIPRIVLSPLYLVNEFGLRRPLGALVSRAERKHWVQTVGELFTFGPDNKDVILPTALFDFGLVPSVGIYLALNDIFATHNEMRFHVATGGTDWLTATALDRYRWDEGAGVASARLELLRRPDFLFLGTGPNVTNATRSRYGLQRLEASASLLHRLSGPTRFKFTAGARTMSYRPGNCCGDRSLDSRIADGSLAVPDGYGMSYSVIFQRTELTLDSRDPRPAPATGAYVHLHGGSATDIANGSTWLTYGAIGGLALDLDHYQRTLTLQTGVNFVDPTGHPVPFNELAQLGSDQMAAFLPGWMNGRSTFVTQLSYRWPVWMWLDGELRFAAGNAFDQHLDGLQLKKLRLSADIGITAIGERDTAFELLFGLGTETIEQGAHITSARFSVGSRKGF